MVLHGTCVMWLDGAYMLPVVCLGAWELLLGGSPWTMFWAVGLSVLTNWYAGYMCCAFAALQLLFDFLVGGLGAPRDGRRGAGAVAGTSARYVATLLLGACVGAAVLVPTVSFMVRNPTVENKSGLGFWLSSLLPRNMLDGTPLSVVAALAVDGHGLEGTPIGHIDLLAVSSLGIPPLLLALPFQRLHDPSMRRQRIGWAWATGLALLCVPVVPLGMLVTGLSFTDTYNPRFMFCILMALEHLCAATICEPDGGAPRHRRAIDDLVARMPDARSLAAMAVVPLAALCLPVAAYPSLAPWLPARVAEGACAWAAASLVSWGLPATCAAGCLLTCAVTFGYAVPAMEWGSPILVGDYEAYVDAMGDALSSGVDGGFFRAETTDGGSVMSATGDDRQIATTGDRFGLGVNGLAHYSSVSCRESSVLLGRLGYSYTPSHRNMTWYRSPMLAADRLLGISRVLAPYAPAGLSATGQGVDIPGMGDGWEVWEDGDALPIAFAAASSASTPDGWYDGGWSLEGGFANQQAMWSALVGGDVRLYAVGGPARQVASEPARANGADDAPASPAESVTYEVVAPADGPLYAAPWLWGEHGAVTIDAEGMGRIQTAGTWAFDTNIVYLGEHAAGDAVRVRMSALPGWPEFSAEDTYIIPATLDMAALDDATDALVDGAADIATLRDGAIAGRFSLGDGESLFLTVPYDEGWRIEVDGRRVEARDVMGLMMVDASPGGHALSMRYVTPGLVPGAAASVGSVAAMCAWQGVARRRRRRGVAQGVATGGGVSGLPGN